MYQKRILLFPAYAGVILINFYRIRFRLSVPRVCGGDPISKIMAAA